MAVPPPQCHKPVTLLTEMNGPKVEFAALVKSGYMLGRPVNPPVLVLYVGQ